jgi:hypothetical protein
MKLRRVLPFVIRGFDPMGTSSFLVRLISRVVLFATLLMIAGGARSSAQTNAADAVFPKLTRGINIHHVLNWPDTKSGGGKTEYVWPPFEGASYQMSDAELKRLKAMGFDFIRVTADPSIFLAADPSRLEYLAQLSHRTVARFIAAGFNVIFDLHPVAVNPDYEPLKLVESISSPAFRKYADLVERLARSLDDLPHDRFAFELMNEPWLDGKTAAAHWQPMMELLHARARKGAAHLPLVLTGAVWSDAKALMQLDLRPFKGSNVLYTFHYYDPHTYTHQGVQGDEGAFLGGLRWPASHENIQSVLNDAFARIEKAEAKSPAVAKQRKEVTRKLLSDYEQTAHNPARLHADFEAVAAWATREKIGPGRVFLGEFGCVVSACGVPVGEDRAEWFRAVSQTAREYGFPWALWAYKGYGGMALINDGQVDPGIAKGLDLPASP